MKIPVSPVSRLFRACFAWLAGPPGAWACALVFALLPSAAWAQSQPIVISPTTLPLAIANSAVYSQTLTATGGTGAAKTFAITGGTTPPGLTLAPGGLLSGVPTVGGTYNFLVTATETGSGLTGSWAYTLVVVGPPTVTTPTVTNVTASTATLGGTVSETGGAVMTGRGVVYSLTSVNPTPALGGPGVSVTTTPPGPSVFSVNVTGLTQGSAYSFRAYATNGTGTGYSPVGTFTTTALLITPVTLPNLLGGIPHSTFFSASGGTSPYTFTVTGGALPPGLTLGRTGDLTGTPTGGGVYNFAITVTDSAGATKFQTYSVVVTPALVITTQALPDHGLNLPGYFFPVEATGGSGIRTFHVSSGSLPFGLNLDQATGVISGTPTVSGLYQFSITVTDPSAASDTETFTIVIGGPVIISTSSLLAGNVGQTNYSQRIAASGGTGFKTFAVTSGTLPPGLNLSPNGTVSGTPTTAGTYNFTVSATDNLGESNLRTISLVINPQLLITTTTLPNVPLSAEYTQNIVVTGGTGGRTFTVSNGALPPGIVLGGDGVLGGSATTAGTYTFTITVTDEATATASQTYTIVAGGPIEILPATLTAPVINVPAYSATLTASGGTGARTFAVTSGSLPTGLSLSSSGVLSGMATAAGTYTFTATATDASGATGERSYTIVVAAPVNVPQTISFAGLPNRFANEGPFILTATASSGLPVTFVVTGPAVLNGNTLTLTGAAGVVTVTASQAGNSSFAAATNVVQSFTVSPADRLVNLSSRVRVAPNDTGSLIAGFVIGGTQPKRVLLRAIGPALTSFGVSGALANPRLQLFNAAGQVVLDNDDWSGGETSAAASQVSAFALTAGSRDAAIVTTLNPGSYTMQITAGTETGIALAEVYDAGANPGAETQRLVNISTRGNVEAGEGVLIGGFVISGVTPKRVLIRGIGPTLGSFGVTGTLADPRLAIFSGTTVVAQNDDWSSPTSVNPLQPAATSAEVAAAAQRVGAFALPAGSRDAAVLVTLAPGAYTAQVSNATTASGVALVEVYEAP